jgi:Ca-activated chloride channel homolog
MTAIYYNHPGAFWLLAAMPVIAVAGWWTRAGLQPGARVVAICIRVLALFSGIVALAEPVKEIPTSRTTVAKIYLLRDRSLSIGNDPSADIFANSIVRSAGKNIEQFSFAGGIWHSGEQPIATDQTNIESALDAVAGAPGDRYGEHVVLMTDGRSTSGAPIDAATRLALRGAKVDVVPIGIHLDQPAHFVAIEPPLGARVGIPAGLRTTLSADMPGSATVRLLDQQRRVVDQHVIPFPGKPTLILHFTPTEPELQNYSIETEVNGHLADSQTVPVYVDGPPRILLVDNVPDEAILLSKAVGQLGMPVDAIEADKWPDDLGPYAAIILSDLSGGELSPDQRGNLRQFVETNGGGLVFIGGSNTITSRWNDNPLRELLPVRLREQSIKAKQKMPDISVVFVLDQSGSMNETLPGTSGNVSKLEMVKAATIASMQSMPENTRVSVIAFEWSPHVVVPPTSIEHRADIATQIDGINCGGGTNMFPAIDQGIKILERMSGDKYLIVLTDGDSDPPPNGAKWETLSKDAAADGISWTSIGVGTDADEKLLRGLATDAGGRYAYCGTGDQIPKVFIDRAKAMRRISQSKQPAFTPLPGPNISDLSALISEKYPPLQGRNLATTQPTSHILLLTDKRDPLLVSWQFGAGKVFAFCSDAKNLWAKSWIGSPIFPKFWASIVSAVARPNEPLHATVRTISQGNHFVLSYRVRDKNGQSVEDLQPHVSVHPTIPIVPAWRIPQPGDYEVSFNLPADNSRHDIDVSLQASNGRSIHHYSVLTGATSLEMTATGPDMQACEEIAAAGQGICSTDPATLAASFRTTNQNEQFLRRQPLWPWFVGIMICLWPIDVLLRKLL